MIHIKLDTGMNRPGFSCEPAMLSRIEQVVRLPGLDAEGIMTHFSAADQEDPSVTRRQFELFMEQCDALEKRGVHIPIRHVANSAAARPSGWSQS